MTRSVRVVRVVVLALVWSAGAMGSPRSAAATREVSAGDLSEAVPNNAESSDRGTTGTLSRVVLGRRRQRVEDLYRRYLDCLLNHDLAGLGQLLDQNVGDMLEGGEMRPREQVIAETETWLGRLDTSALAGALPTLHPLVQSVGELRRLGPVPAGMRSDDWLVTPVRLPTALPIPRQIVVRWVGDGPLICGVPRPRTHF